MKHKHIEKDIIDHINQLPRDLQLRIAHLHRIEQIKHQRLMIHNRISNHVKSIANILYNSRHEQFHRTNVEIRCGKEDVLQLERIFGTDIVKVESVSWGINVMGYIHCDNMLSFVKKITNELHKGVDKYDFIHPDRWTITCSLSANGYHIWHLYKPSFWKWLFK